MNFKNVLYCCNNGKDYLMNLKEGSKIIRLTDLLNGFVTELPARDHEAACSQLKEWKKNSITRLPRSFAIETHSLKVDLSSLRETLAKLDLTLPESFKLKRWIIFHDHESIILDGPWDEENQKIPIVDKPYLDKILRSGSLPAPAKRPQKVTGGIFSNAV